MNSLENSATASTAKALTVQDVQTALGRLGVAGAASLAFAVTHARHPFTGARMASVRVAES